MVAKLFNEFHIIYKVYKVYCFVIAAMTDIELDRKVPSFDGKLERYREYRKRVELFKRRCVLEKRCSTAALLLMGNLTGLAWDVG